MSESDIAFICRALSDVNRVRIISLLGDKELCACRLLDDLAITQPTLSHHMKTLRECALIETRKEGKWMHYSLNQTTLGAFKQAISELAGEAKRGQE